MIRDTQEEIIQLKKEKNVCILAHSYQAHEILEVADFVGDSFQLSALANTAPQKNIIMCGVRFMAETVKIISPEKKVYLANPDSGCPMAEQIDYETLLKIKKGYPNYTVVAYINTTAELKTICDVCVTSSSAVKIIGKIENDNIIFIPDRNLGSYVAKQLPNKNIKLLQGGCPAHASVDQKDVEQAKKQHPNALLLVHPECPLSVCNVADFIGSTSAIMNYAKKSNATEFIIGTELSIAEHLQYECPGKHFYYLSKKLICQNMRLTTLIDVLNCLKGISGEEIILGNSIITKARKCIDRMIELG